MAAPSTGAQPDVRELFNLLEANDIHVVNDITKLVQENLVSTKESWLVCSLVDYYYISHSEKVLQILVDVHEPHDKHLVEKLNDGIKTVEHKLAVMKILLCISCKQPIWIHKLVTSPIYSSIIKCLKSETDIPVVMTGVMVLTVLLPSVPSAMGNINNLQEIFNVFSRLIAFNDKKPGNVPDVFLLHLQVALYSLFHRLYGMFPYNFLTFLRHHYNKKENAAVFDEFVKPMLDRVRMHPHLITSTRDQEVSPKRWRQMETQDIVIDCAKMSLDSTEGMWEELTCPIVTPRYMQSVFKKEADLTRDNSSPGKDGSHNSSHFTTPMELSPASANQSGFDIGSLWSPSMMIGLSTPPPSRQTTPLVGHHDVSFQHSYTGTIGHTPLMTPPADTPRATPPIGDEADKSQTSSRRGTDNKRLSTRSAPPNRLNTGSVTFSENKSGSVPPSPLRVDFTTDPPIGTFKPRQAIRELRFDPISESKSLDQNAKNIFEDVSTQGTQNMQEHRKQDAVDADMEDNSEGIKDAGEKVDTGMTNTDEGTDRGDLMDSFSMDTLPKVIQELNHEEDRSDDEEVSELTRNGQESFAVIQTLTAESVQQFMKKVNRIRFNSLTAANNIETVMKGDKTGIGMRSRSCPQLPKIESPVLVDGDEVDSMSRSVSETLQSGFQDVVKDHTMPEDRYSHSPEKDISTCHVTLSEATASHFSKCPAYSTTEKEENNHKNPVNNNQVPNDMLNSLRRLMMPASVNVCQKCRGQSHKQQSKSSPNKDDQISIFDFYSPPELLDRHLRLGGEVHAKELSKIPITSQESVSWTHFGGMPPADEVNILRGQIFMIQNQLMYERHKRELHARRNRRLLRKIANTKTLEEQNSAMNDQLKLQEREIQNLNVSHKLLQGENRRLRETQESNEYETKVQMRTCVMENNDLKSAKTELGSLLVRQREEQDILKQKLQEKESKLFQAEKEIDHLKEQVQVTQNLKERVFHLHKELLLMGELHQKYQEQIQADKLNRHFKHEQELLLMSYTDQIQQLKNRLTDTTLKYDAAKDRMAILEESAETKEITLSELKKNSEDIKSSHNQEIEAIEEKYRSMLKINQQLQGQILQLYSQVDELRQPKQAKGSSKDVTSKKEDSPSRERTGSDPTILTNISKTPLCKMSSVPAYCEMKDSSGASSSVPIPDTSQCSSASALDNPNDLSLERQLTSSIDDTASLSSRESGLFHFASRTSTMSYSDGEDRSISSKNSNLFDSGYCH